MSITKRIDAVTAIPQPFATETPPPPRSVKIELTARCDYMCFFCASGQRLRERSDMDISLFKKLAKEIRQSGVEELGLFYLGESFLIDWLPEAIRFAKQECGFPYVFLTTNGRRSTLERIRECIEAGLDSLKFSFNHSDEKQFQEVTGVAPENYNVVKNNIKGAKTVRDEIEASTGHRCGLYASSILYDGEQQERMQDAVTEIIGYVDEHYYLPLYNQGALTTGASTGRGYIPTAGNQGRIGALRDPVPCWSAFTEGHVTYDGFLSACCFDHSTAWQMGDLKTTPFMQAWHSEPFRKLRNAHLKKMLTGTPCEHCVAYA
jgi:hypothetical protein